MNAATIDLYDVLVFFVVAALATGIALFATRRKLLKPDSSFEVAVRTARQLSSAAVDLLDDLKAQLAESRQETIDARREVEELRGEIARLRALYVRRRMEDRQTGDD